MLCDAGSEGRGGAQAETFFVFFGNYKNASMHHVLVPSCTAAGATLLRPAYSESTSAVTEAQCKGGACYACVGVTQHISSAGQCERSGRCVFPANWTGLQYGDKHSCLTATYTAVGGQQVNYNLTWRTGVWTR